MSLRPSPSSLSLGGSLHQYLHGGPPKFAIKLKIYFLFNNQTDALIIQIYSVIKLYMFEATSLPIIRIFLLYIRHW